jgi:hypothetical protein
MESLKDRLNILNQFTYAKFGEFIDRLSEAERSATGSPERWSARDNLAHSTAWLKHFVNNLAAVRAGQEPEEVSHDYEATNAQIFAAHQFESWEKVVAELKATFASLDRQLEALSEAELLRTDFLPWSNGRALWKSIAGNSTLHPLLHLHLVYYLAQAGRSAEGLVMYESAHPYLESLSDERAWRGELAYDLACVSAQTGDLQRALTLLSAAFAGSPELKSWASQDSDLASLWENETFKKLVSPDKKP